MRVALILLAGGLGVQSFHLPAQPFQVSSRHGGSWVRWSCGNSDGVETRAAGAPAAKSAGPASILRVLAQGAVAVSASFGVMAAPGPFVQEASAGVVMLPRCEGGRGDGCEAMAEGNEFIRNLQKRSSDNYEATAKKHLERYNYNNFKDYFAFKGQVLTIRKDGTFVALDKKVHQELEKQGKVSGERWLTDDPVPQEGASSALNSNLFASPTAPIDEAGAAPAAAQ